MAEYIDKNGLIKALNKFAPEHYNALVNQLITKYPAADVVEVRHGEWIDRYNGKYANPLYVCSICGQKALYEFYTNELDQIKSRQALTDGCPHCLAKMDGGKRK